MKAYIEAIAGNNNLPLNWQSDWSWPVISFPLISQDTSNKSFFLSFIWKKVIIVNCKLTLVRPWFMTQKWQNQFFWVKQKMFKNFQAPYLKFVDKSMKRWLLLSASVLINAIVDFRSMRSHLFQVAALVQDKKLDHFWPSKKVFQLTKTI